MSALLVSLVRLQGPALNKNEDAGQIARAHPYVQSALTIIAGRAARTGVGTEDLVRRSLTRRLDTRLAGSCDSYGKRRRLAQAFGPVDQARMPLCRGRRPHLRASNNQKCGERVHANLLGASNLWFGDIFSTMALPSENERLPYCTPSLLLTD